METNLLNLSDKEIIDYIEAGLMEAEQSDCILVDFFTKGMYVRELAMPKGTVAISKIHKTEHPFVVSMGAYWVWMVETGWQFIQAPYTGITKPGARRIFIVLEDTILSTFHPTSIEPQDSSDEAKAIAAQQIEDLIIEKNNNQFIINKECHF